MVAERKPPPPKELGTVGAGLWRSMTSRFIFHEGELELLRQACA